MKKYIFRIIFWVIFLLFFIISLSNGRTILRNLGFIPDKILIAGTGSMYPTFPKGEKETDLLRAQETVAWPHMKRYPSGIFILGYRLFGYTIKRGDIVDFSNSKTEEITKKQYGQAAGFVKRIIALPGDTVEVRDGFVYINGQIIKEPYTASPRSTYGGDYLPDCNKLTIPKDNLFVMGDNRKGSLDSRFSLGLIRFEDVQHVLPNDLQEPYEKNWRNTDNDEVNAHRPTLDVTVFIDLVNNKRTQANLPKLRYNKLLSLSSTKRAEVMLKTDDFSIEASQSGYTLEKSITDAGYENIISAETLARGYYDSSELLENLYQFPETKKLLLNKDYQDIGLSAVVGDVRDCPMQVVVVHFGGYIPPNYTKEEIDSWQKLDDTLKEVIPCWLKLKVYYQVNQEVLQKLLDSFSLRKSNTEKILYKLTHNLWLTKVEKDMLSDDKRLSVEEDDLINQLKK